MPTIKRAGIKAQEKKTGFESYDGPEPSKRGMYRSKITQANFKQFKTGSQGYVLLLELEAEKGDPKEHAKFDGYPIWTNLIIGDKEAMITREENFLAAVGAKDEPNVVIEEGDLEQGVKIKTIGGKNPVGQYVNADIKMGQYNGEPRPEVDGIYKVRSAGTAASTPAPIEPDEEEDLLEGDEAEEAEEMSAEEREAELNGYGIADLRKLAKDDYDLKTTGLKKPDLIGAILDYEYGEPEDAEEPEDEEEDEAEEVEESDEIEEEEDDEEEEEDEEADDERGDRERELAELDRNSLKVALKAIDPDAKVLKRHTDDDLRELILAAEFGADEETPF